MEGLRVEAALCSWRPVPATGREDAPMRLAVNYPLDFYWLRNTPKNKQ